MMRYTDLTNEELEAFVDMSKMLCDGKITASRFIQFFTELEKAVDKRMTFYVVRTVFLNTSESALAVLWRLVLVF